MKLIDSVISCLHEVSDWKVQDKWGNQLLPKYLKSVDEETQRLYSKRLTDKMAQLEENSLTPLGGPNSSG